MTKFLATTRAKRRLPGLTDTVPSGKPLFSERRPLTWMMVMAATIALCATGCVMLPTVLPGGGEFARCAANLAGALTALLNYAVLVRFGEERTIIEIAMKNAMPELLLGALIGVATFGAIMAVLVLTGTYHMVWLGLTPPWPSLGDAIRSSVVEELIARGVMLRILGRVFGTRQALALSAALFGAIHLVNANATLFAAVCVALEAGVLLGAFYFLTGRLWISIGLHGAWNFVQSYVFGAPMSGIRYGSAMSRSVPSPLASEWMTGGAFGPEASFPAVIVCLAVSIAVFAVASVLGRSADNWLD